MLIMVTKFSDFLANGRFSWSRLHIIISQINVVESFFKGGKFMKLETPMLNIL